MRLPNVNHAMRPRKIRFFLSGPNGQRAQTLVQKEKGLGLGLNWRTSRKLRLSKRRVF